MAVAFTSNLNANTEAVARAIWSKIQNKTRINNAPNNLKNLWTLKSRVNHNATVNYNQKFYKKLNAPLASSNNKQKFPDVAETIPKKSFARILKLSRTKQFSAINELSALQRNAAKAKKIAANRAASNTKIEAIKKKRITNLVRLLKLNNLKNDPIEAGHKINNLRPGQRFINKTPLLRALTNQDIKNLREFWRQAKPSEKKNITSILRSEANNLRNRRAAANAAALASASARANQVRANNAAALRNKRNRITTLGNDILKQVGGFGKGTYFRATPGAYNRTAARFKNRINGVNKKALTNYINSLKITNKWKGKNNGNANRAKAVINILFPSKN